MYYSYMTSLVIFYYSSRRVLEVPWEMMHSMSGSFTTS